MKKTIHIKCKGSRLVDLSKLKIIQGELKALSPENAKKLRKRITEKGFDAPFFVWRNNILDGTQRKKVLDDLLAEGWTIGKVPVCDVTAKNLAEAKDRLLGYIAQYGKVTVEGLSEFLASVPDVKLDLDSLDVPDFDMANFNDTYFGQVGKEAMPALSDGERPPFQQITFTLHDEQVAVVKEAMKQAKRKGPFRGSLNENSNGNALARIARKYCGQS